MGTTRYFSGSRHSGQRSVANEMMRFEMQKKGKLPAAERYKRLLKKKLEENQKKAMLGRKSTFSLAGSKKSEQQMSKRAQEALKEISARKAAKQAKIDRNMVIVQPKNFSNGHINKKGQISDIAGNVVGTVDRKNGNMATSLGWKFGKYKPKNYMTDLAITGAINNFSPYYINLRKMQAMQQGGTGVWGNTGDEVINVHGGHGGGGNVYGAPMHENPASWYGEGVSSPRQNVGVTAWGAMSDNTWGTFADNVWGGSMDTVWGTNSSDVWGGVGGNPWGDTKGRHIWGTGNGVNHLKKMSALVARFLGLKTKQSKANFHEAVGKYRSSRSGGSGASRTVTRAPTRTSSH
jgi:hypothetical protein